VPEREYPVSRRALLRLTKTESKRIVEFLNRARRELGLTYSDLDAQLDTADRWAANVFGRGDSLAAEHACDLLHLFVVDGIWAELPKRIQEEARRLIETTSTIKTYRLQSDPPTPRILLFAEDVPAVAASLSRYLDEHGIHVAPKLLDRFFSEEIDGGVTTRELYARAFGEGALKKARSDDAAAQALRSIAASGAYNLPKSYLLTEPEVPKGTSSCPG
jgi:hypothetical protein